MIRHESTQSQFYNSRYLLIIEKFIFIVKYLANVLINYTHVHFSVNLNFLNCKIFAINEKFNILIEYFNVRIIQLTIYIYLFIKC